MRILTVVGTLGKGGTERAAQNFAEAYLALGHDSRVLATRAGGVRQDELAARGVHAWVGMDPPATAAIRDWRPEIVHLHSHGSTAEHVRAVLACCPGAAVIETNVFSRPSPWVDAVDVSFQLSTWCRWLYAHRAGAGAPSAVVGNPVRVAGFRRASDAAIARFRAAHGIDGADVVIGRIGQADDSKWSRLLVRALEYLRGRGLDARLVVVNAPPSILARCRASAHAAAVVSIDQVIGDEALSEVYSAIDLFVHVADGGESFGLVLAESMLCETPPVTLSTPWKDNSQGEVVEHGIGGLVATRPAGFLAAMESLARDRERRRDLGRRGRERILERFESSRLAREALAHAADAGLRRSPPPDRAALVELYRNAGDRPSWLTCFLIGRAMRLELTRYTTGYQPWSRFFMHCLAFLGRRCGLVKRHHG